MGLLGKLAGHKGVTGDDEIKNIIANLNNVLNSTRDYGYFVHNFGLSDYNYLCTREDVEKAVIGEVTETIANFEPRIRVGAITVMDNDKLFRLSFRIDCVLNGQPHSLKLFLDPVDKRYRIGDE
jgi:predicted component of type VI protein secretion system